MSKFGVWYTCYKEREAIEYSLEKLYEIYPECPVYLVSDGGYDYSYLEEKHPFLKTFLEYDSRGWCQMLTPEQINNIHTEELQEKLYDCAMEWMRRQKRAVDWCKKPFMLMMETDVLVRGELTIPDDTKLLGNQPFNVGLNRGLRDLVDSVPGSTPINSWGWPLIYSSEAFNDVWNFIQNNDELFRQIIRADFRFGTSGDVTLPVCFALRGYKEIPNPDLTECIRNPNWRFSGHPLLHQFREKYPKKNTEYDGRHANGRP